MKRFSLLLISFLTMSLLIIAQVKMFVHQKDGTLIELLTSRVDSIGFVYPEISDTPDVPDTPVVLGEKLYFVNTPDWSNVYVYIWSDGTGEQYSAWPGVLANKEDIFIDGFEIYSFDMKGKEKYDKIIFNNGSGGEGNQTSDLNVDYETPYYMLSKWYKSIDEIQYHNGHEYVDLGLPSGLLWATCNVGADSPEDYGDYFAWGETESRNDYGEGCTSYKWARGSGDILIKYFNEKEILDFSDDAANANWGGNWRMPTSSEIEELINECDVDFTSGLMIGPNGNCIDFPLQSIEGASFSFWSSSKETRTLYANYFLLKSYTFKNDTIDIAHYDICKGLHVRPVLEKEISYTVTFDSNGGEGVMSSLSIDCVKELIVPDCEYTRQDYTFVCWNTKPDGTGVKYVKGDQLSVHSDLVLYAQWGKKPENGIGTYMGHEYIDLGLPSGILWATCNIGAESPEESGFNFKDGEIVPNENSPKIKYEIIEHDAANFNWGAPWRMPEKKEMEELLAECTWTVTEKNGVKGFNFTGPNGNSIFMPRPNNYNYYFCKDGSLCLTSGRSVGDEDDEAMIEDYYSGTVSKNFIRPVSRVRYTYEVTFDSNADDAITRYAVVKYGEDLIIPEYNLSRLDYEFICWNTKADGTGLNYISGDKLSVNSHTTLYAQWYKKEINIEHDYVDLGLSVKWATCNLGASKSEDFGYYYKWGASTPNYERKWYEEGRGYIKYCIDSKYGIVDNKTILELTDDAANVCWGDNWRMPTKEEIDELISKCTWSLITQNGVNGYKIISKINGNSIFLPATGLQLDYYNGIYDTDSGGFYLSSSLVSGGDCYGLFINAPKNELSGVDIYRDYNYTVRPVKCESLSHKVTFDRNDAEEVMSSITVNHAELLVVPKNDFIRPGYEFICWNTKFDGSGTKYDVGEKISVGDDITLYAQWQAVTGKSNGYSYVDLGLPSGTKWATLNIGAKYPEDGGDCFAWGETVSKDSYTWETYKWMTEGMYDEKGINKYTFADKQTSCVWYDEKGRFIGDNKTVLDLEDDAANVIWGGNWRMPTQSQIYELRNTCSWECVKKNGVEGYIVTGPNGNSIFLPIYFIRYRSWCGYWSNSLGMYSLSACNLQLLRDSVIVDNKNYASRYMNYFIRPVLQ